MPELPEAETIRCQLEREVVGETVRDLEVREPRMARNHSSIQEIAELVVGHQLVGVGRRGKAPLLLLNGDQPSALIFRLGMTGLLRVVAEREPRGKATVATLPLTGGRELRFLDQRKFGSLHARAGHAVHEMPEFQRYGPEPLSDDFTVDYLERALARRTAKLEMVLMDQQMVAGIGKIYADEICFRARLRPGRRAAGLTGPMRERVWRAVREVLSEGIDCRGASARDEAFRDVYGIPGTFQDRLYVYQRTGQPCRACGAIIRRTRIPGGRGMHWCPQCQR